MHVIDSAEVWNSSIWNRLNYRMGTNFRGWLNFVIFEHTSQTAKNNPSDIFVRLRSRKNTHRRWARQAREWCSFITFFQTLTTEEILCCFPLPSLVHWSTSTIAQLIRKGHGNYTHNKSAKIKIFKILIIKMFQQKGKLITPEYPYGTSMNELAGKLGIVVIIMVWCCGLYSSTGLYSFWSSCTR